jgi:hypothetical protein
MIGALPVILLGLSGMDLLLISKYGGPSGLEGKKPCKIVSHNTSDLL